jgi:hypothetical protein
MAYMGDGFTVQNTASVVPVVEVLVVTPVLAALVGVYRRQTFFHLRPISSTIHFQVIV